MIMKDQKRDGEGGSKERLEDNAFYYSSKISHRICYRDKSSIHLHPLLWMMVCPTGISSANPTSAQTVLTELTVVSMVARQTSTSSCDWMTVFVPCWTLAYLVTVFPVRAWWANWGGEEKSTPMNWICLCKYGPKSESRSNLLNKTIAYRSAQPFGNWVSLNLPGDYFTVWFCFVQSICDWLSRVGCNFLVMEKKS